MDRLDKILVSQNVGSRKEVQKLIKDGAVCVNGECIRQPQHKVNAVADDITVSGQPLLYSKYVYIMMNKPAGVLSASNDKRAETVIDLLPKDFQRPGLFPAGRLDKDTEGLLIITNDGEFAHNMLSPKKHVEKKYIAELDGEITDDMIEKFEQGIVFADGTRCLPGKLEIDSKNPAKTTAVVTICEGKFHQVKKMFAVCGKNVVHLKRISIGNLYLDGNLPIGSCKTLSELDKLSIFMGKMY
ncbi:pseudouridine synthase [Ruminococcus sp.]|uniref:pseudouridine synthase n=1 Tax=Ruminococcus sp. TaxID=41978 RepID=UPI00386C7A9E